MRKLSNIQNLSQKKRYEKFVAELNHLRNILIKEYNLSREYIEGVNHNYNIFIVYNEAHVIVV